MHITSDELDINELCPTAKRERILNMSGVVLIPDLTAFCPQTSPRHLLPDDTAVVSHAAALHLGFAFFQKLYMFPGFN